MAIAHVSRRGRGARKRARASTRRAGRVDRVAREYRRMSQGIVQSARSAGAGEFAGALAVPGLGFVHEEDTDAG
jgi:hypothetical protein